MKIDDPTHKKAKATWRRRIKTDMMLELGVPIELS
jgi:hypothetical protein